MTKYYGVLFNRRSGEIVTTLEGLGCGLLKLYGIQGNVSKSRDYVVFDAEEGNIIFYCEGRGKEFPNIVEDMKGKNISYICKGLLEELNNN